MYTYKTVPAPKALVVTGRGNDPDKAIRSYADVINSESVGGWEFYSMETITTQTPQGCFGGQTQIINHNMLVFRKEI